MMELISKTGSSVEATRYIGLAIFSLLKLSVMFLYCLQLSSLLRDLLPYSLKTRAACYYSSAFVVPSTWAERFGLWQIPSAKQM